ncbi:hypothetical protein CISG_09784 [Coccidioides immitis RMSCC 3703]|uniref:Uncharacterized protein n=2 Tax=Coccidioides immitis TaxID=5501 RepID=A0A0J8QN25_COCIT|nr:hypothetical protein CIRG_06848 [Coccidioides immitis RMSCC 2394]KMU72593.1 hypothetical protein CISG_09784 [Coccidioides immitis RMSCC 3703]
MGISQENGIITTETAESHLVVVRTALQFHTRRAARRRVLGNSTPVFRVLLKRCGCGHLGIKLPNDGDHCHRNAVRYVIPYVSTDENIHLSERNAYPDLDTQEMTVSTEVAENQREFGGACIAMGVCVKIGRLEALNVRLRITGTTW